MRARPSRNGVGRGRERGGATDHVHGRMTRTDGALFPSMLEGRSHMKCHTMPPLRRVVGRRARSRQSCAVWLKRGTSVRVPSAKVHWCEMKRSYGRKQKLCSNPFGLPHSKTLHSSGRPVSASFIRAHKSLHGLLSPGDSVCEMQESYSQKRLRGPRT